MSSSLVSHAAVSPAATPLEWRRQDLLDQILIEFEFLPDEVLAVASEAYSFRWQGYDKEEGLVTALVLKRALKRFSLLDQAAQDEFLALLFHFPPSDDLSAIPQSCLLKALAFQEYDAVAFQELARELGAFPPEALLQLTSLADVHHRRNDDAMTGQGLLEDRFVSRSERQVHSYNDSGKQNYRMSCWPAVSLLYRGEIDPGFALKVRREGFFGDPSENLWVSEQTRQLTEAHYVRPPWRINHYLLDQAGIFTVLDALHGQGDLDAANYRALAEGIAAFAAKHPNYPLLAKEADKCLAGFAFAEPKAATPGESLAPHFPGLTATERLHHDLLPFEAEILAYLRRQGFGWLKDWGVMDIFDDRHAGMSGVTEPEAFTAFDTGDDFTETETRSFGRSKDLISSLLLYGQDVPVGMNGHVRLLIDVRERDDVTEVLHVDPEDGTTQWLPMSYFLSDAVRAYLPKRDE